MKKKQESSEKEKKHVNYKFRNDVKIEGDLTVRGKTNLNGVTISGNLTPVTGVFSPGTKHFPTIQSIFDFLRGKVIDNVLIDLMAPSSGVFTYDEMLDARGIISVPSQGYAMPQSQYPLLNFSELTIIEKGLSVRGDPRYASGMNYVSGAQLNYFNDPNTNGTPPATGYVRKLGTPYGYVSLLNPAANQIQVLITSAPLFDPENNYANTGILEQPNFGVEDVQPGDHILIRDNTGIWDEYIISAVAGNILTYNGNVTALGTGAELILLPRIRFTSNLVPVSFGLAVFNGVGVTIQGVWFQNNVAGDTLDSWYNSFVKVQQCVMDSRNNTSGLAVAAFFGGIVGTETSGIRMHNAVIGGLGGIGAADGGRIDDGDWVASDAGFTDVWAFAGISSIQLNSVNTVGGVVGVYAEENCPLTCVCLLGSYNPNAIGVLVNDAARVAVVYDNLQLFIGGSIYGVIVNDCGVFAMSGGDGNDGAPYFSQVVNCSTSGFLLNGGASVGIENQASFLIDNCLYGVTLVGGSRFVIENNVTFGPGVVTKRVVEVGSECSTAYATDTPNNILIVTTSGTLDSGVLTQVIDQPAGVTLSFDPSAQDQGYINLYIGKRYLLSSINNPSTNTLTLLGGAIFIGAGTPSGSNQTITFGPAEGSGIDFTVLSATRVRLNSIVNGSVSLTKSINNISRVTAKSSPKPKRSVIDIKKFPLKYQDKIKKVLAYI